MPCEASKLSEKLRQYLGSHSNITGEFQRKYLRRSSEQPQYQRD